MHPQHAFEFSFLASVKYERHEMSRSQICVTDSHISVIQSTFQKGPQIPGITPPPKKCRKVIDLTLVSKLF